MYECESWTIKKAECWRIEAFELWCSSRLLRIPWTARRSNQSTLKEINPGYSLEELMWTCSSNTLATWCEEPTHWERSWYWERVKAGEGNNRGWNGWMASPTQWTWVWVNSRRQWSTGKPGICSPWGGKELDWKIAIMIYIHHYYIMQVIFIALILPVLCLFIYPTWSQLW